VKLDDGRTGLLRYTDTLPGRRLLLGEEVTCRVKAWSPKLALTMKRSKQELSALTEAATRMPATVTGVKPFGLFVDLGGVTGLLHRSEMDLLPRQQIPYRAGENVSVRILSGVSEGRISVSSRALFLQPARHLPLMSDCNVDLQRLRCFHGKVDWTEDILGVGVSLEAEAVPGGETRYHLASIYDVLAHDSFRDGVRKGVWKQRFSMFLPLALDAEHFGRAQSTLEASLAVMSSGKVAEKTRSHGKSLEDKKAEYDARITLDEFRQRGGLKQEKAAPASLGRPEGSPFTPVMVLEVLPKLMNSQVVLLASGQLWRCEKALEGYMAYHHLLLRCLEAYPTLRTKVEVQLRGFLEDPEKRVKERVKNLGELLCLTSVSDHYSWGELGVPILEEAFDRNVLWILKQAPHLGELSDDFVSRARLRESFKANRVSLRLLMFQFAFLKLAKAPHTHEPGAPQCQSASCGLCRKDRCKGLPGPGEAEWLFQRCLQILAVEDFGEFLELVGAAPMTETEVSRWLRRSVLRSISKGYHNPRLYAALAEKRRASKQRSSGGIGDPEDFGMDTRNKETKADKRARKAKVQALQAGHDAKLAEYQRALWWARVHNPFGYQPRQSEIFCDGKKDVAALQDSMGPDGKLQKHFQGALPGYQVLGAASLDEAVRNGMMGYDVWTKAMTFPTKISLGLGCRDCGRLSLSEVSGLCMPCCKRLALEPTQSKAIQGLTGAYAPVARFTAFQAMSETPVLFEMRLEVGFKGLTADLSQLRAALADDLTVKEPIQGGHVFTLVSRAGKKVWQTSPEQIMTPGCQLINGYQGVTEPIFRKKIRDYEFVLLGQTMQAMKTLEDLDLLKLTRTYCKDHQQKDDRMGKIVPYEEALPGISSKAATLSRSEKRWRLFTRILLGKDNAWNRPCKNCRGILRLHFRAPRRYAERMDQLRCLNSKDLASRASLCGLIDEVSGDRSDAMKVIVKSEGIIR
jgi:hypothetical protein